jgi:hypothetical protein
MSTDTVTKQTTTPCQSATGSDSWDIASGVFKVAGLALLAYRAYSAAKHSQLAKPAEPQVRRSSDSPSMAKVDPNILFNMGLRHMQNMTRITTR